jgi:hypothetical protein
MLFTLTENLIPVLIDRNRKNGVNLKARSHLGGGATDEEELNGFKT